MPSNPQLSAWCRLEDRFAETFDKRVGMDDPAVEAFWRLTFNIVEAVHLTLGRYPTLSEVDTIFDRARAAKARGFTEDQEVLWHALAGLEDFKDEWKGTSYA